MTETFQNKFILGVFEGNGFTYAVKQCRIRIDRGKKTPLKQAET